MENQKRPFFLDFIGRRRIQIGKYEADMYAILANFSTLANLLLGFLISFFIIIANPLNRILAMRFLMLGASFDAIDGRLARLSNTKPRLGAQFDTAADLVSFGFAPGFMIIDMYYNEDLYFAFLLAGLYLFSASFRLSRFMLEPTFGYFKGMPSPVAALFVAALYLLEDPDLVFVAGSIALISVVMIVSLPYTGMKEVRSKFQLFYFVFTIVLMLLLMFSPNKWFETLAIIWIAYLYYFTILGPLHGYHGIRKLKAEQEKLNAS
ncbi:MAG: CDP-alcohol phosphatidyltransferase family protein [Candidatus Kariarchaeaceae archaeon]|jgi:CDP-diacylglycerol--serine O-phosphatidyltransferase